MAASKIAIFTKDDYIWLFPTWARTIPELINQYDVVGIYLFPEELAGMRGIQIPLWYFRTFGLYNFILLGLYSIKVRFSWFTSQIRTWEELASRYNIKLNRGATPNSKIVCDWVKENNIDVILITLSTILKENIINSPNIGIINKHAATLPSCRGVFPFLWAKITGAPIGITFYEVDSGIDTGKILVQMRHPSGNSGKMSMLRFYIDVFYYFFPLMAPLAVERLIGKDYRRGLAVGSSYYGYPTKEDFKKYRSKSCSIAQLSDFFYQPNLQIEENI